MNLRGTYIDDLGRKDADCDRVVSDAGFGDADRGLTDSGSVADFDNWDLYEDPSSVRHHGRIKSSSVPSFAQNTSSTVAELGPKNDSSATDSDNLGISSTGPSSATDPHNSTLDQTNSSSVTSVGQNNLTGATGLGQNNSSTAGSDNSNIKHANPSSATDLSQSKLRSATAPHEEDTASLDHAQPDPKIPIDLPAIITANSDLPHAGLIPVTAQEDKPVPIQSHYTPPPTNTKLTWSLKNLSVQIDFCVDIQQAK